MAMSAGYKPSPLGYGSPRGSPFRRPESPASPSTTRHTTPTPSPTKSTTNASFAFARSIAAANASVESPPPLRTRATSPTTPSNIHTASLDGTMSASTQHQHPSLGSPIASRSQALSTTLGGSSNALSQLQPTQLRTLRDGFQILDRDSDGVINKEDVADMLNQLGLPSNPKDLSAFFPHGSNGQPTLTLAVFLNSIAGTLAQMSDGAEMLSAFSAFDDDDSGQVDLAELRTALLHTTPEDPHQRAPTAAEVDKILAGFSGRRAFSRHQHQGTSARRGEVFKYQEFVNSIVGGAGNASEANSNEAPEG